MAKKKRKPGRPKALAPAVEAKLLKLISEGTTMTQACRKLGIGRTTVDEKDDSDREFADRLARTRARGAWALRDWSHDELRKLLRSAKSGKASHELIATVREILHQARWDASKLIPTTFGDRLELQGDLTVNAGPGAMPDKPFASWTRDERLDWMRRTVFLLAQAGRELRDTWGLESLAEGYGFLGNETWKQVLALIDGRKEPTARPAALLPAPPAPPVYREIDRRPKTTGPEQPAIEGSARLIATGGTLRPERFFDEEQRPAARPLPRVVTRRPGT